MSGMTLRSNNAIFVIFANFSDFCAQTRGNGGKAGVKVGARKG